MGCWTAFRLLKGTRGRLSGESKHASSGHNRRVVLLSRKKIFGCSNCDDNLVTRASRKRHQACETADIDRIHGIALFTQVLLEADRDEIQMFR